MKAVIGKGLIVVVALAICYGGLELAHKNGIRATLQMKCEKLNGFKSIESLNVPWFSLVKKFTGGAYACTAKLTMTKADGADEAVNVQFGAAKAGIADDWATNWYPWGDEYKVSNLKRDD